MHDGQGPGGRGEQGGHQQGGHDPAQGTGVE